MRVCPRVFSREHSEGQKSEYVEQVVESLRKVILFALNRRIDAFELWCWRRLLREEEEKDIQEEQAGFFRKDKWVLGKQTGH